MRQEIDDKEEVEEVDLPVRCGICKVEITGDFDAHRLSKQHLDNLPTRFPRRQVAVKPVKQVSETTRKKNKAEFKVAQAENLGYYPAHGKSSYKLRCECGEISHVYCWSGSKRCRNCYKLLHLKLSFVKKRSL